MERLIKNLISLKSDLWSTETTSFTISKIINNVLEGKKYKLYVTFILIT